MLTKRQFLGALGGGLATIFATGNAGAAGTQSAQGERSPAGTWMITSTATATGGRAPLLAAINSDGSFLRAGQTHPLESPGFGAWMKTGPSDYEITYTALGFDVDRNLVGSRKTWIRATMNETFDEFTAVTRGETYDREGNVLTTVPNQSTLEGKRFQAEPYD